MYVYKNTYVQKYIYPRFAAVKQPAPCVVCRDGHPARLTESRPQTPPETRLRWCRKGLSSAKLRMVISIFILCILLCIHVYIYVYCYVCYYCYIFFIYINMSQYYSILIPSHHGVFNSILGTPRPSSRAHFSPHPGAARARTSTKLFVIPMCSYKWGSAGFGFIKTVYPLVNIQKTMENHYF